MIESKRSKAASYCYIPMVLEYFQMNGVLGKTHELKVMI